MTMAPIGSCIWIVGSQCCNYLERTGKCGLVGKGVLLRAGFEVSLNFLQNFTRLTFPFSRWKKVGAKREQESPVTTQGFGGDTGPAARPMLFHPLPLALTVPMVNFPALCWFTCPPITATSTCVQGWANRTGTPSAFFQGSTVRDGESVVRLANLVYK